MDILEELEWRGLFADCTDREALAELLKEGPVTLYCGFDPTADSLHVGNLVPLLALRRFQLAGHRPIALAGGATGSIGDPSGKTAERQLLDWERLQGNIRAVKEQLSKLLDFQAGPVAAQLLDNATWTAPITFLDFLRDIGKHFTVNQMVAKESVRARMEDRDVGISYTEFSYMLLQAFDFMHLADKGGCRLQIGGSDQWGNITAGIDLCRKKLSTTVYGLTLPLITNADGSKFGKSVAGAIWLDPARTSVYRFYQFWIRTDDRDVVRYLRYFTFLDRDTIAGLEEQHAASPEAREAHKALAWEMTCLIHGEAAANEAIKATQVLFGGSLDGVGEAAFADVVGEVPTRDLSRASIENGIQLLDLLVEAGVCPSKGQARRDVTGGGIYVNNLRQEDPQTILPMDALLFGKHLLLRKGKRNYTVATFADA